MKMSENPKLYPEGDNIVSDFLEESA